MLFLQDRELSYDRLVLATGSRSLIPNLPGVEKKNVVGFKDPQDADFLKKARGKYAVIVGSGPVGIEVAISLRRRGWSVTLLELMDRVLPRIFDAALAGSFQKQLEAYGIQVVLEERLLEIHGGKAVNEIQTDRRALPADLVVLVLGMRAEVDLAKKGGLQLGPSGGIHTDEAMRVNHHGVWACGDCVESFDRVTGRKGLFMLWNNARIQGRIAGANAAGAAHRYPGSLNITTVKLPRDSAASIGLLASDLSDDLSDEQAKVLHRKGLWGELWLVLKDDRLIGVQAIGRTERVGGFLGILLRGGTFGRTWNQGFKGKGWNAGALRDIEVGLRKGGFRWFERKAGKPR